MLHGRLLGGLLARTLEAEHGAPGLRFGRLTVDLFRSAPLEPVEVTTVRIRDGHRIRVAEATASSAIGLIARATAVQLRAGEQPPGRVPATPDWDAPDPLTLPPAKPGSMPQRWRFNEGDTRRIWLREPIALVDGEELSPFVRAALAADMASPLAHGSDGDLEFINADYTLYLSRPPVGEHIGLQSGGHTSDEGVAVGLCTVYDRLGPVGYSATAAVANPGVRPPRRPRAAEQAAG
ncbi:thioesterase family protein [Amycolatopsis acidiphila]|uniref:Thioesterase family protein n=2 Tax=Amycolatopsis acidiphila TaxID=715473 RepID=A0A558A1K6_9PSEU|nr:thioesterase family protein [Amycolatopsis acidiphila]